MALLLREGDQAEKRILTDQHGEWKFLFRSIADHAQPLTFLLEIRQRNGYNGHHDKLRKR
jgi:hypothetical protein